MALVNMIETRDYTRPEGERLVLHEAAFIDVLKSMSVYAVALCGAEFRQDDGWVSSFSDPPSVTCPECRRRGERRTRVPIIWRKP